MSWFEAEYLITARTDSVIETLTLFISIQLAIFVAIYFLQEMRDHLVRHAIMFFYSLAFLLSFTKTMMDMTIIGSYTQELAEIIKQESGDSLLFGQESGYAFTILLAVIYLSAWTATVYFLYFHKFEAKR